MSTSSNFADLSKTSQKSDSSQELCISIFKQYAQAFSYLASNYSTNTHSLITLIENTRGRVIFSGLGKSGLIAQKCSATFSSLGIPSFFLHPTESLHGDLGACMAEDLFIIFSKRAEGDEFKKIITYLKKIEAKSILVSCISGSVSSYVDHAFIIPFQSELSYFPEVPLVSTAMMMAFCDALGLVVALRKGFSSYDFALRHPAGALGNSLLLTVDSLMYGINKLSFLEREDDFKKIINKITLKNLGIGIVVSSHFHLEGVITEGDLRRACDAGASVFQKKADQIMSSKPYTISANILAIEALRIMQKNAITALVVVEGRTVIGLVRMQEIINAGIKL